jgi:hypothetical protein
MNGTHNVTGTNERVIQQDENHIQFEGKTFRRATPEEVELAQEKFRIKSQNEKAQIKELMICMDSRAVIEGYDDVRKVKIKGNKY